jgi:sugar-specific transcriptional regulator TrmB
VGEGQLTAYDVAKVLDVAPAKWIYDMMNKLVADGVLQVNEVPHRSNTMKRVYRLCSTSR